MIPERSEVKMVCGMSIPIFPGVRFLTRREDDARCNHVWSYQRSYSGLTYDKVFLTQKSSRIELGYRREAGMQYDHKRS